ncbi:MAG TPA: patatin-like phospholipase family protein [Solirubrobacteraceae bacterium]|jgi:NTE family protein|nr:patatin-like phospholipase family protein [Solirubrobacteraceae bacterium]
MTVGESTPALALGGGGILGEAWMNAVLAGLEQHGGIDARAARAFIGTSAGSIVAAALAAGIAPADRLERTAGASPMPPAGESEPAAAWSLGRAAGIAAELGSAAAAPLAAFALGSGAPAGAAVRRLLLRQVPEGRRSLAQLDRAVRRSGARWDGRLRVAAVELESGRRVCFGAPGAPSVEVATAVCASCAIPGVFEPVRAAGRTYVDGGAWSPTNMDALDVGRGESVLCLNPTGSLRSSARGIAGAIGSFSRARAASEALALRHRGVHVEIVNPDARAAAAMGLNLMDSGPREAVIEAGLAQGRTLARASAAAA